MSKYVCIHGHFYQPPRENSWLDEVENQPSAFPYHDWNQRVTAECYAPNTASRILDSGGKIIDIVNNYSKISFNFGPTLLSWMEKHNPETYGAVLAADRESIKNFSGHGSAMAQCYNHMIMPLANPRDKETQVLWGIADFEHRFGRKPEGMWLSETAVDYETLDIMAHNGISFVILSPHQASSVRKKGSESWINVEGGKIDPKRAYECPLPSGKKIAVFFYDGPASNDIAFSDLLKSGVNFANRLVGLFDDSYKESQLVNIASDGETFGHHHKFGDMSLAYCLYEIENNHPVHITIYAEFLEKYPPKYEAQIIENSAWSCAHGVGRWKEDCGCKTGLNGKWNQKWRKPLRETFDFLRDRLCDYYEQEAAKMLKDPWKARNDYISFVLKRNDDALDDFFGVNSKRILTSAEKTKAILLLEMQRYAMLMYTSCGWFFDELSGIETVQIIQYASRAVELCVLSGGPDLGSEFTAKLEEIPSNVKEFGNGRVIYEKFVKTAFVDFLRVGAHYAITSFFINYDKDSNIYSYSASRESYTKEKNSFGEFAFGKIKLRYSLTNEEKTLSFAVVYLGGIELICGVKVFENNGVFEGIIGDIRKVFEAGVFDDIVKGVKRHFNDHSYKLGHLFKDEQIRIFGNIFSGIKEEKERMFSNLKDNYYQLLSKMKELNLHFPKVFGNVIEHVLNRNLRIQLKGGTISVETIKGMLDEINHWGFKLDDYELSFILSNKVDSMVEQFVLNPKDTALMDDILANLKVLEVLPLELNLWKSQNIMFGLSKTLYGKMLSRKQELDSQADRWISLFNELCLRMKIKLS